MPTVRCALAFVAAFFAASSSAAASFDCSRATTEVEKMICASAALSALDDDLAKTYAAARTQARVRNRLLEEQKAWIAEVRDACEDESCLEGAYRARIARLRFESPGLFGRLKLPATIFGRYSEMTEDCYGSDVPAARERAIAQAKERGEMPPEFKDDEPICLGEFENFVAIRRGRGNVADVSVELLNYGGFSCQLEGKGEWLGDEVRVVVISGAGQEYDCALRLTFSDNSVHLQDPGARCKSGYCGANASFDDTSLPRVSANPDRTRKRSSP